MWVPGKICRHCQTGNPIKGENWPSLLQRASMAVPRSTPQLYMTVERPLWADRSRCTCIRCGTRECRCWAQRGHMLHHARGSASLFWRNLCVI